MDRDADPAATRGATSAPPAPETVAIRGGTVVTMGPDGVVEGDVLVEGGRIVAVGPAAREASADEVVDAAGALVVPGFVQAHVHLCQTLMRGLADEYDVIDWLRERIWPLEQAHDAASLGASAALGAAELLLGGTTTVLSMESVRHTDASFEACARIGIRATIGKAAMDRWEPGTEMVGETTDDAWADLVALVERWHGAEGDRLRVALSPRGPRNCTEELWRRCGRLAEEADLVLHTHVDENRDQAIRLTAAGEGRDIELLDDWGVLGPRLVMAHCVWLSERERELVRRRLPHVCHCPSANLKLASGIAPVPELLADGVNVALGADGAPCNNRLDAFAEMRLAALLHKPRLGPRAMPAAQVVEMATMGGARALGLEREVGSLEPGKRADVVVLRPSGPHAWPATGTHPAERIVYALDGRDVDTLLVDGRFVVRGRRLCRADLDTVRAEAERQRAALLDRAGLT